jgi:ABC-type transport system involved in cytochrome bd biosynthesis fused ATPase/permease subunit
MNYPRSQNKTSDNFTNLLANDSAKQKGNRADVKASQQYKKGIGKTTTTNDTLQRQGDKDVDGMENMKLNETDHHDSTSAFLLPRNGHIFKGTVRNTVNFSIYINI